MYATIMIAAYISYINSRINEKDPQKIFEIKFNFELPPSAEIINYTYKRNSEDLKIKILFDSDDYDYLMENIKHYINNRGTDPIERKTIIPYFENTCSWWDMDKTQIIYAHTFFISRNIFMHMTTKSVYIFIVKKFNEQYYLYAVH